MLINIRKETENDCNDIKSVNDKVISQKNEYETLSLAPMSVLPNYQKIYFYYRIGSLKRRIC